jgi:hypothetical protein
MPKVNVDSTKGWTFGIEHEFADWDTRKGWQGFDRDPEPNVCNSNGIATSPNLSLYPFGGEINTPPTVTPSSQAELLEKFMRMHPRACATHRAGLHVHIRVPGLKDNLALLKRVQRYITENTAVYQLVDPLPIPDDPSLWGDHREYLGARKRQHWMRMSHWTKIPEYRVGKQLKAKSTEEFFKLEAPIGKDGTVHWACQPRAAINLRQLLQTDTIEFRHFSASVVPQETINACKWCRDYLLSALNNGEEAIRLFARKYRGVALPKTEPYIHWRELRWLATSITKNPRDVCERNIAKILAGKFDRVSNKGLEYLIP